ncbi:NACHT domain-containing protein [Chryseobacterium aahli]|uniref:NACHT domain-containing protein n=1 Tax=Chryseobacterium aahli TaxID=1278643 RepID=UPI001F6186C7|nr:NACHT domain-containing protein [Chryseobacterium aahli]MCI3935805.1 NACHT domain-containing protein [Chryseobacterium aahli]
MIKSLLIKQGVSEGISLLKKLLKNNKIELITSYEDLENAFENHNNFVINSTKQISFKELSKNRNINDVYIDLDIELQRKSVKFKDQISEKSTIKNILTNNDDDSHIIILGDPGAGKTTTIKHICQILLTDQIEIKYQFPILIYLRDITDGESIYSKLKSIFGIEIATKDEKKINSLENVSLREKYVNTYINSFNCIIILDGLDEVKPRRLDNFYNEIKSLMLNLTSSLVVLTSRSASYNYHIENSVEYEICELNENQINEFIDKWFTLPEDAEIFKEKLYTSKFLDLSLRPLTLAHLCAIFEKTRKFYDKPKSIYKKLVRLLIEEWDEQRRILRESIYADFDNDRKFDFLAHFAYDLTISYSNKIYSEDDFKKTYERIYKSFELPKNENLKVIKEIEEHNGIIIKSSYDSYEFVHKSMQEYLAAEYIVKMPAIPVGLIYDTNISNELAIAVSLSSQPDNYFFKLVFDLFNIENLNPQFAIEFMSRLEYERPTFKKSLLIPFSFIHILNLLRESSIFDLNNVQKDFTENYNEIIKKFCTDKNFRISLKQLANYIDIDKTESREGITILCFEKEIADNLDDDEKYYLNHTEDYQISTKMFKEFLS